MKDQHLDPLFHFKHATSLIRILEYSTNPCVEDRFHIGGQKYIVEALTKRLKTYPKITIELSKNKIIKLVQ